MNKYMERLRIAVDGMGGVNAPLSVVKAIKNASLKYENVEFLIYGNEEILKGLFREYNVCESAYNIIQTNSVILDTDKPTDPLRNKKDSSMRYTIDAVKTHRADACVSAGNTGALMLTARMILGSIENVKRPAIAGIIPTLGKKQSQAIFLDMGANINCDEIALSQFAIMGSCFAKVLLNNENPTIGILNVGHEESKGRELEQKTYAILSGINGFIGFVEGHDVIHGKADVVVTDGFSGNIFLKASEGAAKACLSQLKSAISSNIITKLCGLILRPYLHKKLEFLDPRVNNGAMFIGINGIVVKSHGGSDEIAFENALSVAINLAKNDVNRKIIEEMKKFTEQEENEFSASDIFRKIKDTSAKILGIGKKSD